MNKKAVYGILIALLIPFVSYLAMKHYGNDVVVMPRHYIYDSVITKTVNGKEQIDTVWHTLPDFTFTNQLGHKVGLANMKDKIIVADFFFTHCPTICPKLTVNMKVANEGIKNSEVVGNQEPNFVQFLSFSIDPERDSVAALKQWANRFGINPANWWLLTGDKKSIYNLSIDHMKIGVVDGGNVDTNFIHTDYIVLIDKDRHIRGYYHGLDTAAVRQLSNDIVLLQLEKNKKSKSIFAGKLELIAVLFIIVIIGTGLLMAVLKKENKAVQANEVYHYQE